MAHDEPEVAHVGGLSKAAQPAPGLHIRHVFKYLAEP